MIRKVLSVLFFSAGVIFLSKGLLFAFMDEGEYKEIATLDEFSCTSGVHDNYTITYFSAGDTDIQKTYSGYGFSCRKFPEALSMPGLELTLIFDKNRKYLKEFRAGNYVVFSERETYWAANAGFALIGLTSLVLGLAALKAKSW